MAATVMWLHAQQAARLHAAPPNAAANEPDFQTLEQDFQPNIRPLLKSYCNECHAGDEPEAEIDLAAFATMSDVRSQPKPWQKVREMLDTGQMPPKDAKQPTDAERTALRQWVRAYLTIEARARAGDPGPLVLRRLNNAEYNYTVQDLTGLPSLDPTQEFPVDGAAGEGFTNTGSALSMSPSLVRKYLDAAKEIAEHAVLLPDGIRFSPYTTRRDRTDELLASIQQFYRRFTEDGGGSAVNLQGIKFNTNQGGRLPLARYLEATLAERDPLNSGAKSVAEVASERGLSAKYLGTLCQALSDAKRRPSPLLDDVRQRWRNAKPSDAPAIAAEIGQWQNVLWKNNSIGHIGREGGPKAWMEPVAPLVDRQELKVGLPEVSDGPDVVVYLIASDAGDGNEQDFVVWERPRIERKDRPAILLRDVRWLTGRLQATMAAELARTSQYLQAAAELQSSAKSAAEVAGERKLDPQLLAKWTEYVDLGRRVKLQIAGHLKNKAARVRGYEAVNGWSGDQALSLLTNRSDQPVSFLTLTIPPRSVVVHPSPDQDAVVAWQSPVDGRVRVQGRVADADDKCGNGAAWRVELTSLAGSAVLASGTIDSGRNESFQPEATLDVRKGEIVSLAINARDRNHTCDTTHVELKISEVEGGKHVWDLASDVVDNVLTGNPLSDSFGHADVWHFCGTGGQPQPKTAIPPGSVLARWRAAVTGSKPASDINAVALATEKILTASDDASFNDADKSLRQTLTDWSGPLDWVNLSPPASQADRDGDGHDSFGLDPARFGKHPGGAELDPADLCVQAPSILEVRLPASMVAGAEFVTTGTLHAETGKEGSVRLQLHVGRIANPSSPNADGLAIRPTTPIIVGSGSETRQRLESAFDDLRNLFPPTLCYARIVPVDEVVTLTLFYREDEYLQRLMLDDAQTAQLDRLWDELYYVSREPLQLVTAFEQISEFATQDRPDLVKAFAPLKKPIDDRADAFRQRLVETEPAHVRAVLELADRAWRRPLTDSDKQGLRGLYRQLRESEIPHEEAIRLTLARILTSPTFLYRTERPAAADQPAPVSDLELANRLSYFLWSSMPDPELRRVAVAGQLTDEKTLVAQARRMLGDDRTRRLAIQFACQWLHVRDFDKNDDKNEKLYPEFAALRGQMYEESVRFFEDMFRHDGSILGFLNADHTFLNEQLAKTYGIGGVSGPEWRRVDGVREKGRGGVLGMATVLASQSGASRTSPILRGNWVSETLLGERLPRPPANVPQLPDALPSGLTARQLIERHSSVAACAKCHARIDPYGFALEQYDAIGRLRPQAVDTKTRLLDGTQIEGIQGLRDYLAKDRHNDVVQQFCRKLLGYSLGRAVQLSDEPLLADMQRRLEASGYRFGVAVEAIVTSRQFRDIRGREQLYND